jgi:SHS2 domain-containing protein
MDERHWQHFPHDADVGIRGFGDTREQAFEQAALAMTAAITDLEKISSTEGVEIACAAPDDEFLLVDWLNAIVYEMAARKMLFGRFEVAIEDHRLTGTAWGEPIDAKKHEPSVEVKGATQTHLRVHQRPNTTWVAECVIDV